MVSIATCRKSALSFPGAVETPHFEKPSFRVNKKIFATLDIKNNKACIKLSLTDQDIFSLAAKEAIFAVPNKWGKQGWTFVDLSLVKKQLFTAALTAAYCATAPQKLADLVKQP